MSAVMHGATRGEPIARADARSNERDQAGAGTLEGLTLPFHVQRAVHGKVEARAERDSGAPAGPGIRGRVREARERRPGEGLVKVLAGKP
jgi:hypothetical protein